MDTVTSTKPTWNTAFTFRPQDDKTLFTERINETHDEETFEDEAALARGFISELNRVYEFRDGLVEKFLEENPSLDALLFEAYKMIRRHFGSQVHVALEVMADPESVGDQQLFVLIRTEFPPRTAGAHLAVLDQEWWLEALPAAEGKMEIALE
jgi:hypothetical protein